MRVTLNKINEAIRAEGGAEELVRDRDYFWFADGNAPGWYSQSVLVPRLSDLTLVEWLGEYRRLRDDPRNH